MHDVYQVLQVQRELLRRNGAEPRLPSFCDFIELFAQPRLRPRV